jgi:hypothetical protein
MNSLIKAPFVVFGFSLIVMWLAARIGLFFRKRQRRRTSHLRGFRSGSGHSYVARLHNCQ